MCAETSNRLFTVAQFAEFSSSCWSESDRQDSTQTEPQKATIICVLPACEPPCTAIPAWTEVFTVDPSMVDVSALPLPD